MHAFTFHNICTKGTGTHCKSSLVISSHWRCHRDLSGEATLLGVASSRRSGRHGLLDHTGAGGPKPSGRSQQQIAIPYVRIWWRHIGGVWLATWSGRRRPGSNPSRQTIEIDGLGRLPGHQTKQPHSAPRSTAWCGGSV